MGKISFRIKPRVLTKVYALQKKKGWSFRETLEKAIELAETEPKPFSMMIQTFNTNGGGRRGKRMPSKSTTISNEHLDRLLKIPATPFGSLSARINAGLRLLVEQSPDRPAEIETLINDAPLEMFFALNSLTIQRCSKRGALSTIPDNSTVILDALIFFYGAVNKDTLFVSLRKADKDPAVSLECLHLLRRIRDGNLVGYTTPGELGRLYKLLCGEENDALKKGDEHRHRARLYIASILKSGVQVLDEGKDTVIASLASSGTFSENLFLEASAKLAGDNIYIATATEGIAMGRSRHPIRTPKDLPDAQKLTA